ncbi:MAG TPA: AAA family ATPase [Pseudomonadales bacterium]|nr:AAA family ATPase [Pseudomonadales bacterium]
MQDAHDLGLIIDSRVPLILIQSHEETRVLDVLMQVSNIRTLPMQVWTMTDGLRPMGFSMAEPDGDQLLELEAALLSIKRMRGKGLFVLCDAHGFFTAEHPKVIRLLKDIVLQYNNINRTVVLLSHALTLPPELRRHAAEFELSTPSDEQILAIIREEAIAWSNQNNHKRIKTDKLALDRIIMHLRGLQPSDVRTLARQFIYADGAISDSDLPLVSKSKLQLLDMQGVLEYEYSTESFEHVGGLANLKSWLAKRQQVFMSPSDNIDIPKGILLLGVQGSGKSLAAKAVAGLWGLPLLRLDFGALYNKYYGESEKNLRDSLKLAENMSPCVLWLDEIEKGIAGQSNDDGTSQRVLGTLLTWMAEKKHPVFIVATSNNITNLPAELIRKGRLDEIFFVDLPDEKTRADIFSIHLIKRKQDPATFDLCALAAASEGFSGAEIEQAIVAATYSALAQQQTLHTAGLLDELSHTRSIAVVMAENIAALRHWAKDRTVPAN